jgi:hypothetical protein
VILSSQRVDPKDTLFDAAKARDREKEAAVNPLVQDGRKLVPSVTRVFSAGREMFVFLQAYRASATAATPGGPMPSQPLIGFVSLYRDGVKAFESPATAVTPNPQSRLGVAPLGFTLNLNGLPAGEYDCQVTVTDPVTNKASFWRGAIVLIL